MITKHHWAPQPDMVKHVESLIKPEDKVLELGPGLKPFSKATHFCGWDHGGQALKNGYVCDFNLDNLPYEDDEFDFVYCRHVLEDIWNPFKAMDEMKRVGKAGYIETPSPIAELCKHVDGGSPEYRGYHHHRWIIWNDGTKLNFLTKFSYLEKSAKFDDNALFNILNHNPHEWNTYFIWQDNFEYKHHQLGVDFKDMGHIVSEAMSFSHRNFINDKKGLLL